ncbi:MAG: hypothetical protein ACOCV9_08145, partial [Marinilabiliaceae bacterium]
MTSLRVIFRFIVFSSALLLFSSFSEKEYEKGDVRHFENVDVVEKPSISQDSTNEEENLHPFDKILKKVIDEDRFVDNLDSASFFNLPVGISLFDGAYSLVVHESVVYSDHAEFDAFLIVTNPLDGEKVRFKASNVKFSFSGGISSFRLELIEAVKTSLFENAKVEWKPGTYAQWDCDGLDHIGLNGGLSLDNEKFVRVDPLTGDETGSVDVDFFTQLKNINDFVVDVSIPAFKVKGFDEAWFEFENAVLDCSDAGNASTFQLPEDYPGGYNGENETLWRGVYVNEAKVYLSRKFSKEDGNAPASFSSSNLLIDDFGFTGLISANNVLSENEGNLGSWPLSIHEFNLEFFTGAFRSLGFIGDVKLPGSNSNLEYDAFLDVEGAYHFGISPDEDIDFQAFSANMEISSTSRIDVFVDYGKFKPTAMLDGNMTFSCGKEDADNKMVSVPGVDFQGMQISAVSPHFDVEYMALDGIGGSSLSRFPLTINNITYSKYGNLSGFSFDVKANLSPVEGCAIKGEGSFRVLADISGEDWQFKRLDVGGFSVDSEKEGAFRFHGSLELFDDDPTYGEGFYGNIAASFGDTFSSEGGTELKVASMFCRGDYGRYFFVDAFLAVGGTTGIPDGPFILNGFGGGLSYGMKRTQEAAPSGEATVSSLSGVQYLPDRHSGLGISAAVQAGIVNESMLKGNVHFGINFSRHGGIEQIRFKGEAVMMGSVAGLSADEMKALSGKVAGGGDVALGTSPPMKTDISILMDHRQNTFDAEMGVWLNIAGAIRGVGRNNRAGWGKFHHEPGEWHLYVGTPTDPVGLEYIGLAKSRSYFMAGHDLPSAMMMEDKVLDILNMSQQDFNAQREEKENNLIKGDGVAFGSHLDISTGDSTFLRIFYGAFDRGVGFDAMLLDYDVHVRCAGR